MTISADLYTLRERARIQALFTSAWGAANILGPIIGGWIVMHTSWRWVFLVNVPVGFLAVAMLLASYRDPPQQPRGSVGAAGALLAGLVAALALIALERGEGRPAVWRIVPAALSMAAALVLVRQQRRTDNPILPPALLPDPVVRAGVLAGVFAGGLLYTCAAYVPLWMAQRLQASALLAGAALVPLLAGWALGSSFGVHVLLRWGMRASVAGGFAIASVGAAALAWAAFAGLPAPFVFAALGLLGLGLGPAASTSLVAPQSHVAWQYRGMITSTIYAARMLGGSLAVTALGSAGGAAWRFAGIAAMALGALGVAIVVTPGRLEEAPAGG
jgi:predicted MFS family arabinose efflux permease